MVSPSLLSLHPSHGNSHSATHRLQPTNASLTRQPSQCNPHNAAPLRLAHCNLHITTLTLQPLPCNPHSATLKLQPQCDMHTANHNLHTSHGISTYTHYHPPPGCFQSVWGGRVHTHTLPPTPMMYYMWGACAHTYTTTNHQGVL